MGRIKIDVNKAKEISHGMRRQKRSEEFAPLDEVIMKQIPGNDLAQAESKRQNIREKYDAIQAEIDAATDDVKLKKILQDRGIL